MRPKPDQGEGRPESQFWYEQGVLIKHKVLRVGRLAESIPLPILDLGLGWNMEFGLGIVFSE